MHTLYDDDIGRVSQLERTHNSVTVGLESYFYGGTGTVVIDYLTESNFRTAKTFGGSDWDLGFDRFDRPDAAYWYGPGGATMVNLSVDRDDNGNIITAANLWVSPASTTYESDNLNRLKGLKFGEISGGSIATVVQEEKWKDGSNNLKLDQTGNWINYQRVRESVTKDDYAGNTFSKLNLYTKLDKVSGTDIVPDANAKGLPTKDDDTLSTTVGYQYVFDAWDRMMTVKDPSGNVVEEFRYNGLGHRIGVHYDYDASGLPPNESDRSAQ